MTHSNPSVAQGHGIPSDAASKGFWLEQFAADRSLRQLGPPESLATPFLCVDFDVLHANLRGMAEYTSSHGLKLRPHIKTHKSSWVARIQLSLGAAGLTAAKPSEAAAVAAAAGDLLLAYPCFTPQRLDLLAPLAEGRRIRMAVDSAEAVRQISAGVVARGYTVGLLVDLDVGHHRTGVPSPDAAVALAQEIERSPGVSFDGVLYFPGQVVPSAVDVESGQRQVAERLRGVLTELRGSGLECSIVSGGSTPTARHSHEVPELTEIRPGTYVFNDLNSVRWQCARWQDCAALVHATVISTAVGGKAVIDAGSKMLTSDRCGATPDSGFGYLIDHPEAKLARLSEEHGEIELGESDWRPSVGERMRILPNHICPVVNLQDELFLQVSPDRCFALPIDGRGCVA